MCELELEPCSVWSESKRRARKEHRCDCCRAVIPPGEQYLAHFQVFEGVSAFEKLCLACEPLRKEFDAAHDMLCSPSNFPYLLTECIAEGDEESELRWKPMLEAIRRRTAAHGPRLNDMWLDLGGEG